ncbi:hypothetical protein [Bacillus toyonensis]|uniref:hypothetical protein n=1 Tax=Bacillus toyonensis TaxID=155322 RepID=UPI002E1B6C0B|nr:hypothetical protein [Bacillus toyonensis]
MGNPFASRMMKRFFVVVGGFIGVFVVGGILNAPSFIFLVPVAMFGIPIYFVMQDNKGKNKCIELIRSKYNQNSILTVEAYNPSLEWGFVTLTKEAMYFVPKKGEIAKIPHSHYTNYGITALGTGTYTTTTSSIGNTGMNMSSTRENKSPIFYITLTDGAEIYWHSRKNEKLFNAVKKVLGQDNSHLKSNY